MRLARQPLDVVHGRHPFIRYQTKHHQLRGSGGLPYGYGLA
jgi:hypothetical protein